MCLSTCKSEYHQLLHETIPCHVIYSVDYSGGTLYALSLARPKTHVTLDGCIAELDAVIMRGEVGTRSKSVV